MSLLAYAGHYSSALCDAHPSSIFLFGDNLIGQGHGGQAIIRDCINAFGIPTKALPSHSEAAFFDDRTPMQSAIVASLLKAALLMSYHVDVIVPVLADGQCSLGCGLAELPTRAPRIYAMICASLATDEAFEPLETAMLR